MYKIIISANTSWYLYNFRRNTIISLLRQGHAVTAIAPRDQYTNKIETLGAKFINIPIDRGGSNPMKDFRTFFNFMKIYSSEDYDIVLNFTPKNNIYSTLAAKKTI